MSNSKTKPSNKQKLAAKPIKAASPKESKGASRSAPINTSRTVVSSQPKFRGGENYIEISHRELVGAIGNTTDANWKLISSTEDGKTLGWALNPNNPTLAPWLSNQAVSWESYDYKSLKFVYIPRCSTTTDGAMQMFIDYDQLDPPPATERVASTYQGFKEAPPWREAVFTCDVKSLRQGKNHRFVVPVSGSVPEAADPTNYYCGTFFIAVQGDLATFGSLWIEYVVHLSVPTSQSLATLPPVVLSPNYAYAVFASGMDNLVYPNGTTTISNFFHGMSSVAYPEHAVFGSTTPTITFTLPGWYVLTIIAGYTGGSMSFLTIPDGGNYTTTPSGKVENITQLTYGIFSTAWQNQVVFMISEPCVLDVGSITVTALTTEKTCLTRKINLAYFGPPDVDLQSKPSPMAYQPIEHKVSRPSGRLLPQAPKTKK